MIPAAGPAVAGGVHKNRGDARYPQYAPLGLVRFPDPPPGGCTREDPGNNKTTGLTAVTDILAVSLLLFWLLVFFSATQRTKTRRTPVQHDQDMDQEDLLAT